MEEQKREELETVEEKKEEKPEEKKTDPKTGLPTRSLMLMTLAGIYLVYTGYSLCKNVLDGVEGGNIGFMLAGIVFLVLGAGMLVVGVRGVYRMNGRRKAAEAAAAAEAAGGDTGNTDAEKETVGAEAAEETAAEVTAEETAGPADTPDAGQMKKMSIAERARLASRLNDGAEEETEEEA